MAPTPGRGCRLVGPVIADRDPARARVGELAAAIAGGGDDQDTDLVGFGHHRGEGFRVGATDTEVDDVRPVGNGVLNALDDLGDAGAAVVGKDLDGHDARAPGHAGGAEAVVADRGRKSRHQRAVIHLIVGIAVEVVIGAVGLGIGVVGIVLEVPAVDVVHEAVAVIVPTVEGLPGS